MTEKQISWFRNDVKIVKPLRELDRQMRELRKKKSKLIKKLEKETDLCQNCYKPSDRKNNDGSVIHQCQSCYDVGARGD